MLIPACYQSNGLASRWVALEMLGAILVEKKMLSEIKENKKFPLYNLLPEQRARSISLLEGVLRNLPALDSVISDYVDKKKTNLRIINILRLAAAEIILDKIAIHAAVDSAVRLTKLDKKIARLSGLVNAVCRKVSKQFITGITFLEPCLNSDLLLPLEIIYGVEVSKRLGLAQGKTPPIDITVKNKMLESYYAETLKANVLSSGSLRMSSKGQISKLPGYSDGEWWVQDFSASLPVRLLGNIKDKLVLDVGAAPGGKTMQIAANGAEVVAVEISKTRAKILTDNLKRTNLVADIKIEDICSFSTDKLFDVILVDAPCSATGTIRRNYDLQYLDPIKRVSGLVRQQKLILKKSMRFIKPGGTLLYCTCSLLPDEGENVINDVLLKSSDWNQIPIDCDKLGIDSDWLDDSGGLRLRPDYWETIGGMDGFYIAMLENKK